MDRLRLFLRNNNSEICKETRRKIRETYEKSSFIEMDVNTLEEIGNDVIKKLNQLVQTINEMSKKLELRYPNEDDINAQKTNPELPLLKDPLPKDSENEFFELIKREYSNYLDECRRLEEELQPFTKNPEFYKRVKEKFKDIIPTIKNIREMDERAYGYFKNKIDNILKEYERLENEPIMAGDLTARLGVIRLLQSIVQIQNKLKEINEQLKNDQPTNEDEEHALNILSDGVAQVLNKISDFLDEVAEIMDETNTETETPTITELMLKDYAKANYAILYISDLEERDELAGIFAEYSNKRYEELPYDVKDRIQEILNKYGIDEKNMRELWDNYVYRVNFRSFIPNERNVITISC